MSRRRCSSTWAESLGTSFRSDRSPETHELQYLNRLKPRQLTCRSRRFRLLHQLLAAFLPRSHEVEGHQLETIVVESRIRKDGCSVFLKDLVLGQDVVSDNNI